MVLVRQCGLSWGSAFNFQLVSLPKEHEHNAYSSFFAQSSCVYLSLAGYVEALASRLGLSIPELTPKQADMWQTRLSAHLVSVISRVLQIVR